MKESTLATKVMIAVLCLGVAIYMAIYFVRGWDDQLVTTRAYAYSQNLGLEATGILVRKEIVLPSADGNYVDQIVAEGEKASSGQAVALLYSDASALTTRQSIRVLSAEIEQLEYALSSGTKSTDASRLDGQVISSIVGLRSLVAGGDLTQLEDSALSLRTMVFKRDYTYGDTAADQLGLLVQERQAQLSGLEQSLSQVSRTVFAPVAGVFSASVDGWEGVITPAMLEDITPESLSALLSQQREVDRSAVGKLITDSTWYFAAMLPGTDTGLQSGRSYDLAFSGDYFGQIRMTLDRIVLAGDQTMAIFSCRSNLADTTLLRIQKVDVVTDQLDGIHIPRKALRVETVEEEQEDGTVREVNRYGVYTVVRSQAEWQEVEVLYTADTYYLVRPVNPDASTRLRDGDEIILNSSNIFDGKVVR